MHCDDEFFLPKTQKRPDQMEKFDCTNCKASGGVYVQTGCFGGKHKRCHVCTGTGKISEEEYLIARVEAALDKKTEKIIKCKNEVVEAAKLLYNGSILNSSSNYDKLKEAVSKLIEIEQFVSPEVKEWNEFCENRLKKQD